MYYILEEWKPVIGYEDYYEVSNYGRVKSLEREVEGVTPQGYPCVSTRAERIMKLHIHRDGNAQLTLCAHGIMKLVKVHRVVLESFVSHYPDGMECLHGDGDPANNFAWNLDWGTHKENMQDMIKHGTVLRGEKHPSARLTEVQIFEIHRLGNETDLIHKEIGNMFGIVNQYVSVILRGEKWKHVYKEYHGGS